MNIAPGPQAQVNLIKWWLAGLKEAENAGWHNLTDTIKRAEIAYNSFADVPAYELPHIDRFLNLSAAKAAMERLHARLLVLFADQLQSVQPSRHTSLP